MDPAVIVDYIDQEPLYGASERCFYYVLHSLAEKGIQIQKYESMYQALDQRFGQVTQLTLQSEFRRHTFSLTFSVHYLIVICM